MKFSILVGAVALGQQSGNGLSLKNKNKVSLLMNSPKPMGTAMGGPKSGLKPAHMPPPNSAIWGPKPMGTAMGGRKPAMGGRKPAMGAPKPAMEYSFLKYDPAMMSTHSMPCTGDDCLGYSMDYSMPCTGGDCMGYSMDYSMPCTGGDCMGSMDMHYDWYTPDYAWSEPEVPMYSTSFLKYHHALDAMWSDAYTGHNALYDDMSSPCQGSACHGMDTTGHNTHSHNT